MASNASMALLNGSKKNAAVAAAAAASAAKEPENVTADEVVVEIEIDEMNAKQLDALVAENQIEVPEGWKKMGLAAKKAWLNENFGTDEGEEAAAGGQAAEGGEAAEEGEEGEGDTAGEADAGDEASEVAPPVAEPEHILKTPKKKVGGKKGKELALSTVKTGEVVSPSDNLIVDVAHEIENLTEHDAHALVTQLRESTDFSSFRLGGVLSVIQTNKWFGKHETFKDYCINEHGIEYRKAAYWVQIYNGLIESEVPWAKVKHLGWTKLKEIVGVLTPTNVDKWVKLAEQQTTLQLQESVKAAKQQAAITSEGAGDGEGTEAQPPADEQPKVTTKTFKVHPDQKKTIETALKKAKEVSGTEVDTVALEFICLDYMAGNAKPLETQLKDIGLQEAIEKFNTAFPEAQLALEG